MRLCAGTTVNSRGATRAAAPMTCHRRHVACRPAAGSWSMLAVGLHGFPGGRSMEVLAPDTTVNAILFFEEVYPARAAQEQAEKSKLNAFGTLARLNPLNRPKADTVNLSKWELRYEPFWHVVARREVDYVNAVTYAVPLGNEHARWLEIEGRRHERIAGPKPRIDLPLKEICHRQIDAVVYQDGLKRTIKPTA